MRLKFCLIQLSLQQNLTNEFLLGAVGFEFTGEEFSSIKDFEPSSIANRTFIQFKDLSARFSTSTRVNGAMSFGNTAELAVENGGFALAFGFGLDKSGSR